ncbi:hypothetical protein [Stutzerimonas nitrititolerans]|uniref:hypothetical protein n=1 Tax=Stutzerimonas nitrititolerans TaxID=2482751 RepID=UPI00289E85BB|nr:hypothetical protein [Stutzerimonas nitrititolerans]
MYLIRKAIVALFVVLFAAPLHAEGDTESLRIAPDSQERHRGADQRIPTADCLPERRAFFDSQQATGLVAAGDADYERLRRYIAR